MMVDINDKGARRGVKYLVTIFKFLKANTQFISDNAIATSALAQVLCDEFPQLAEKYEERRRGLESSAPVAVQAREMGAQVDVIIQELETLLETPS